CEQRTHADCTQRSTGPSTFSSTRTGQSPPRGYGVRAPQRSAIRSTTGEKDLPAPGKQTELRLRQVLGAVDVRQEPRTQLDNARLELLERRNEGELSCAKPPFEDGQRAATVRAGQRPSLRHSGIAAACRSELLQRLGRDERQVNRKRDDHVETGGTQTGDNSRQRSPNQA